MITVFGSINLDLIGNVERLPKPGETVGDGRFATAAGGKGGNQALAAARAGAAVRMIGAVGRDANAAEALALLREGGVGLAGVRETDMPTGVALILVDRAGENVIAVMPGANFEIGREDGDELEFRQGDVLLLQLEIPIPAIETTARRARAAGIPVLLNFAPFRAEALSLLPHVTHLIVNESECALAAEAAGLSTGGLAELAASLSKRYGLVVVVTLGKDGVIAAANYESFSASALSITPVDTVGAGDTFCGYLAAALAGNTTFSEALAFAASAGSLACTKPGAQPAIPWRDEVLAALKASSG